MRAKVSTVTLHVPALGMERAFGIPHAERLLAMRNNGGWELPEDSPYVYSPENGLTARKDTRRDNRAE